MRSAAAHGCWCGPPLSTAAKMGPPRDLPTPDLQPRPSVSSAHGRTLLHVNQSSSGGQSSETWTSTSGDIVSDTDEIENRDAFVDEYNRLARKVCLLLSE